MFDPLVAAIIEEDIITCEGTFEVLSSMGRSVTRNPPEPLNTVELQKRACRITKATPQRVLQWAEELYQSGYISYPRTETNKYPSTFDLSAITRELTKDSHWGSYAQKLITNGLSKPRAGNQDDGAHPPIYPARQVDPSAIGDRSSGKYLVYELVARHFLASVSPQAVGTSTEVNVQCAMETFTAKGLCIEQSGYLEIYGESPNFSAAFDRWAGSGELPRQYIQGEILGATRVRSERSQTEPPQLLTEPELIAAMDRAQIGTDATQAGHIDKVVGQRGYAERTSNGRLKPTKLGEALAYGYKQMGLHALWQPDFRAKMEAQVNSIASNSSGNAQTWWQQILDNLLSESETQFCTATSSKEYLEQSLETILGQSSTSAGPSSFSLGNCPSSCQGEIHVSRMQSGMWRITCSCDRGNTPLRLEQLPASAEDVRPSASVCRRQSCPSAGRVYLLHLRLQEEMLKQNEAHFGSASGYDFCALCDSLATNIVTRVQRKERHHWGVNQQQSSGTSYQQQHSQPAQYHFNSIQRPDSAASNSSHPVTNEEQAHGHPPPSSSNARRGQHSTSGRSSGRGNSGRGSTGRSSNYRPTSASSSRGADNNRSRGSNQGVKANTGRGHGGRKGKKGKRGACFRCGSQSHWSSSCTERS